MKFFRYRHRAANGPGSWDYFEDASLEYANMRMEEEADRDCRWSDLYRGYDLEEIDIPPKEWIDKQIKSSEQSIEYYQNLVERYQNLLNSLKQ